MAQNPLKSGSGFKLMQRGTRVNLVFTLGFMILAFVSGGVWNSTALLIVFLVLALASACAALVMAWIGSRRYKTDLKSYVQKAKEESWRRYNG